MLKSPLEFLQSVLHGWYIGDYTLNVLTTIRSFFFALIIFWHKQSFALMKSTKIQQKSQRWHSLLSASCGRTYRGRMGYKIWCYPNIDFVTFSPQHCTSPQLHGYSSPSFRNEIRIQYLVQDHPDGGHHARGPDS